MSKANAFHSKIAPKVSGPRFRFVEVSSPNATAIWFSCLRDFSAQHVTDLLAQVPRDRLSAIGQKFTHTLLMINRNRLLKDQR